MEPAPCNKCSNFKIDFYGKPCTEDCPELLRWEEERERNEEGGRRKPPKPPP